MTTSKTSRKSVYVGKKANNVLTDSPEWVEAIDNGRDVKTRVLFLRTYHGLDVVRDFLTQADPEAWAYIEHSFDVNEDGTPKQPHIHLLVKFGYDCRLTYIAKHFKGQQTLLQKPNSLKASFEYLTHKNHCHKFQYSPADIVSFMSEKLTKTNRELKSDSNEQFLDDISHLTLREMAIKYGRDYMRNYHRYNEYMRLVNFQASKEALDSDLGQLLRGEVFRAQSVQCQVAVLAEAIAETMLTTLGDVELNTIECLSNALAGSIERCVEHIRKNRGDYNPYID